MSEPNASDPYAFLLHHPPGHTAGKLSDGIDGLGNNSSRSSVLSTPAHTSRSAHTSSSLLPIRASLSTVTKALTPGSSKYGDKVDHLRRFAQLIGGRVAVDGELPPIYTPESSQ